MDTTKYARVSLVLDVNTASALRFVAHTMDRSVSAVARDLLSEPIAAVAETLGCVVGGGPAASESALEELDLFVEQSYGAYLSGRNSR